eukprot:g3206.t1
MNFFKFLLFFFHTFIFGGLSHDKNIDLLHPLLVEVSVQQSFRVLLLVLGPSTVKNQIGQYSLETLLSLTKKRLGRRRVTLRYQCPNENNVFIRNQDMLSRVIDFFRGSDCHADAISICGVAESELLSCHLNASSARANRLHLYADIVQIEDVRQRKRKARTVKMVHHLIGRPGKIEFQVPVAYLELEEERTAQSDENNMVAAEGRAIAIFKKQIPRQLLSGPFFSSPTRLLVVPQHEIISSTSFCTQKSPSFDASEVLIGYVVDVQRKPDTGDVTDESRKYLRQALLSLTSLRWFGCSLRNARVLMLVTAAVPLEFRQRAASFGATVRVVSPLSTDAEFIETTPHANKIRLLQEPEARGEDGKTKIVLYLDCDVIVTGNFSAFLHGQRLQFRAGRAVFSQMFLDDPEFHKVLLEIGKESRKNGENIHELLETILSIGWPNTGILIFPTGKGETRNLPNECVVTGFSDAWLHYTSKVAASLNAYNLNTYFTETVSYIFAVANCVRASRVSVTGRENIIHSSNRIYEELPIQMNLQLNWSLLDLEKNGFMLSLEQFASSPVLVQYAVSTLYSEQSAGDICGKLLPYNDELVRIFPFLDWINDNFISRYNSFVQRSGGCTPLHYEKGENIGNQTDKKIHYTSKENISSKVERKKKILEQLSIEVEKWSNG